MKKSFRLLLGICLVPLLSSCSLNPSDWIVRERDYSKLYFGGFPTISYVGETDTKDYCLYVTFRDSSVPFDADADLLASTFNPKYDFFVDLDNPALSDYGVGSGLRFFSVSDYFSKYCPSYAGLNEYFTAGNYIDVFSSVGVLTLDDNHSVSTRSRIGSSGQFVAFNTVASNGGVLTYANSYCYKETFTFGGKL